MSKYEWKVSVKGRQYQVRYVNGLKTVPDLKGLFVDNCRIDNPIEKTMGLNRLYHEFVLNGEKVILQVYGTSCDLILDGVYVKHKIPANRNVLDWSAWIGFLVALLSFSVPLVLGWDPWLILVAVFGVMGNTVIALSPFYRGWKKVLYNVIYLAIIWLAGFWLTT